MRHELSKIFKCHYVFLSSYCTKSHDWLCHINCKRRRAVSFSSLFLEQDIKRVVYDCPLITTSTLYMFAGNYISYIIIYHWYNRGFFVVAIYITIICLVLINQWHVTWIWEIVRWENLPISILSTKIFDSYHWASIAYIIYTFNWT